MCAMAIALHKSGRWTTAFDPGPGWASNTIDDAHFRSAVMIDWRVWICGPIAALTLSAAAAAGAEPATGLDLAGMNPAIRPQDDLFGAMNGKWIDQTPIPPDKAEYGVFYQLRDKSDERVRGLIEELAAGTPPSESASGKV